MSMVSVSSCRKCHDIQIARHSWRRKLTTPCQRLVGCPSPRVQKGAFGAVLMKTPLSVVDIIQEMAKVGVTIPITVKCRIGVDNLDSYEYLYDFVSLRLHRFITTRTHASNSSTDSCFSYFAPVRSNWFQQRRLSPTSLSMPENVGSKVFHQNRTGVSPH